MTPDPLMRRALELLSHGHSLYSGAQPDTYPLQTPAELPRLAERLMRVTARDGVGSATQPTMPLIDALHSTALDDDQLRAVRRDAQSDHSLGLRVTRMVLDDAHGDSAPAADTPLGRREALRRMAGRVRTQRRYIRRSRQHSRRLARRARQLAYLYPRRGQQVRNAPASRPLPLHAVRYQKSYAPGHIRQRIAEALDHLGITDRAARRDWIRGYQTLIARESGGRASAIASEPATAVGPTQSDGHGVGYARGITQTIPATFARFHQPGTSTNIYDPVANICASINYVIHRYGVSPDGWNFAALVQQADVRRPPKGY